MNWLLTAVVCIPLVEFALRLPFVAVVAGITGASVKALRTVRAQRVSDHWKERALGAYARKTLVSSLKLAGLLAILFASASVLVICLDRLSGGFQEFLLGWRGILASLVAASLYLTLRKSLSHGRL